MKSKYVPLVFLAGILSAACPAPAQTDESTYVWPKDPAVRQSLEKWQGYKFGLLIHMGLYSVLGTVESWGLCPEDWVSRPGYDDYCEYAANYRGTKARFNPVNFDPGKWARWFKSSGARYVIYSTKHHDGFCLYDTLYTDFKVTDPGCPFSANPKADIYKEVLDACRKEGLAPLLILAGACRQAAPQKYEFRIPGMTVTVDGDGALGQVVFTGTNQVRPVRAFTELRDCEPEGPAKVVRRDDQVSFQRKWVSKDARHSCLVTDQFSPGNGSLRWDVEVTGLEGPWSVPIETWLVYPETQAAKFWTAWGDPRLSEIKSAVASGNWNDPLLPVPFTDDTIWYGAPPYRYNEPRIGFMPFQGNLFGIPLVTISEEPHDQGLSLVLSPEDTLLDLGLRVHTSGEMVFSREYHRISSASPVRFRLDLVAHESGWRGGLRWMTINYPGFFDPNIPLARDIDGTGAYSSLETAFDAGKMRKMAFGVNWKASFDFPYMGMFIPPVETDTTSWRRYGGGTTTVRAMRDYAARMKSLGFHVLSYFNVTEFGADITDPPPPRRAARDEDLWKNADDFLYGRLAAAILHIPTAVPQDKLALYGKQARPGGPYYTWGNGIIMDPGEAVYRDFLLDQAEKHIRMIPDAEGICIDRMDWLRMYNEERDDAVSWFANRPTRSLLVSWKGLLETLGPLIHQAGKVIFVNNHDKRIDVLRQTDGFFDEFTYGGSPLNLTALMGVRRPVLGWTAEEKDLRPDPDAFFQRYLHLGVFPMAPFPGNDHSLLPSAWVDRQYLDYGLLLRLLKGRRWVLEPHCVEVVDERAKVNLFEVPGGWVVPVTFGPKEGTVTVILRNVPGIKGGLDAEAAFPGTEKTENVALTTAGDEIRMTVGTRRGCAVVRILPDHK